MHRIEKFVFINVGNTAVYFKNSFIGKLLNSTDSYLIVYALPICSYIKTKFKVYTTTNFKIRYYTSVSILLTDNVAMDSFCINLLPLYRCVFVQEGSLTVYNINPCIFHFSLGKNLLKGK